MPTSGLRTRELEAAIDAVARSYDGPGELNNLESAALPSRRAVIEAYNHLTPVLYLGFYSTRSLNRDNLRHSISEHLYPAHALLVDQIERAIRYEEALGRAAVARPEGWSEDVVLRLLLGLPALREQLSDDVLAAYRGDPAAKSIEEIVFSYPSVRVVTAHRIAHILYQEGVPMIPRILSEYAHCDTGADLHPGARIGRSFFIDHCTGVVVGETAEIGNNVKLYQGVTLGALSTARQSNAAARGKDSTARQRNDGARQGSATGGSEATPLDSPSAPDNGQRATQRVKRHPTIEDDVTIYAGATILGGDTVIGRGSTIGGNVWLVRSVPPDSKVFGKPRDGSDA